MSWRVYKFGGTSVSSPERLAAAARIVGRAPARVQKLVVVSALAGVTDWLLAIAQRARSRGSVDLAALDELAARHFALLKAAAGASEAALAERELRGLFVSLELALLEVARWSSCSGRDRDRCASFGERLSVPIAGAALASAGLEVDAVDARDLIVTDEGFGEAVVDFDATRRATLGGLARVPRQRVALTAGFIAAGRSGATTTLGRGGSDYSAAVFGRVLDAERVEIWTDVDGVLSADPGWVEGASTLRRISPRLATRLAECGAKVLHRKTVAPLAEAGIPLAVGNTARPERLATWITSDAGRPSARFGLAARRLGGQVELTLVTEPTDGRLLDAFVEAAAALSHGTGDPTLVIRGDGASLRVDAQRAREVATHLHQACQAATARAARAARRVLATVHSRSETFAARAGRMNARAPSAVEREPRAMVEPKSDDAAF